MASAVQSSAVPTFGSTPNSLNCIDSLDDVTFWIVDIETGEISDQKTLSNEYIYLTNHAGVHLYKDTLAVTSIQHQSLYLIHISQDGKFGEKKTVGYHNNEDDETYLESCRNRIIQEFEQRPLKRSRRSNPENIYHLTAPDASYAPFVYKNQEIVDNAYSGIKQRMMSFLYKRARESDDRNELNHFSLTFDLFANLVMWRSHLLNDDEIMFKFGTVDVYFLFNLECNVSTKS